MMKSDILIIGSGYGGAVLAARLSEAGFKVKVLERGKRLDARDFRQSDEPDYLQSVIELYVTKGNMLFRTGNAVGGASLNMDGAHFRMPKKCYEIKDKSGRPVWPEEINYFDMLKYYQKAEKELKIRLLGWNEVPKAGGMFAKMLDKAGASCDRARMNYLDDCLQCGFCAQGCKFDKKMSLMHNYIPLAEKSGAVIESGSNVSHIEKHMNGYKVHYERNSKKFSIETKKVIVACGGVHSPALLLRSKKYLNKLSDQVGENFNNNGKYSFIGILPQDFEGIDDYYSYMGMDNAGMMSWEWFQDEGFTFHPGGGLEPSMFAAAIKHADHPEIPKRTWGLEYKNFVRSVYPKRVIAFTTMGMVPSSRAITIDNKGKPDLIDRGTEDYEKYTKRVDKALRHIESKTGVSILTVNSKKYHGTTAAHLLSACKMGDSAKTGVTNADGEVYGNPGLYVCDASSIAHSLGVNPALTIAALAERTAEKIIHKA